MLWRDALAGAAVDPSTDPAGLLAPYLLSPDQLRRAAQAAGRQALLDGGVPIDARHLRTGVRAQNAAGLERLARRVEPAVGWDDLVLPPATAEQLGDLALRARHRDQVLGAWRMRPGGGRGRGVMALFAGDSGTGKTMSAEVVAADLGLDLYVVDLSTVVDKYVGETEKNLERIFTEAAGINGILLFDEADAIFGKRSEVKDAHDRYANMESAYLLQRMESFDGIAILTTNLRANLDEAFTRRLDVIVDFPVPDPVGRRALWDRCLGPAVPAPTTSTWTSAPASSWRAARSERAWSPPRTSRRRASGRWGWAIWWRRCSGSTGSWGDWCCRASSGRGGMPRPGEATTGSPASRFGSTAHRRPSTTWADTDGGRSACVRGLSRR